MWCVMLRDPVQLCKFGDMNFSSSSKLWLSSTFLQAMSGIEIDQEIKTLFDDMKLRKTHKWATFKISDNKKSIEVDQKGDPMPTESREDDVICFNELMATLGKEPRYILYDFSFKIRDGRLIQKLAFIFW